MISLETSRCASMTLILRRCKCRERSANSNKASYIYVRLMTNSNVVIHVARQFFIRYRSRPTWVSSDRLAMIHWRHCRNGSGGLRSYSSYSNSAFSGFHPTGSQNSSHQEKLDHQWFHDFMQLPLIFQRFVMNEYTRPDDDSEFIHENSEIVYSSNFFNQSE